MTLKATAVAAAAGAALLASTSLASADTFQVPIAFPSNLTALGDTLPFVADMIEKASDGDIVFEVTEPGKIVKGTEIFDAVSSGKVQIGYSWMGYEIGQVPASALFGATPFGLEPWEYIAWYYQNPTGPTGQELVRELYAPYNVYPILCGTISPEAAGWFSFPLENLEQMQGLKFRAAGLGGKIMERMGASVTVLPGSELYQALEKGVLDATEFSLPTVDDQLGFYKVVSYYHLPGWHQPSTSQYLYVNMETWNDFDSEEQGLIEMACMAANTYAISRAEALQGPMLSSFVDKGVTAVQLPEEILRELQRTATELMEEEAAKDEMFAKVYESMMTFKAAHAPWKELGYLPRDF